MKKEVLVINYHQIAEAKDAGMSKIDSIYSVRKSSFRSQVEVLLKNNIPVVSLQDLVNNNVSADFSVAITVDDGYDSDFDVIYPILKENSLSATFFWLGRQKMNWEHAREMSSNGFFICSHGIMHEDLTGLDIEDQQNELAFSKRFIEEKINGPVDYFAFPFGAYNNKVMKLAGNIGYKAVMTSDVKFNYPEDKPFLIHRWSIKRTTTLKEFEGMMKDRKIMKRKISTSNLKILTKHVLGKSISHQLCKLQTLIHNFKTSN